MKSRLGGIFERIEDGKLSVAKVTFWCRAKKIYEVQEYIQKVLFQFEISVRLFENCCKGYQKKSETDAAGSKEADAGNRHWYKIATGVEITTGTEQAGTQREKTQEKEAEEQRMFELKQRKKEKSIRDIKVPWPFTQIEKC